ncbi:MAG: penicillin-binding protein 2 [Paludibacteraceae bacterium]|nr:penicillin-binding protein 2 [Paludibacteraceae bacterium]
MINDRLYYRRYVISAIIVLVVLVLLYQLFHLQIGSPKYKDMADSNAFLKRTVFPVRGLIYDRNGELLVYNQAAYDITVIMREIPADFDTTGFCEAVKISRERFDERMGDIKNLRKNRGYSPYTPQTFMSQLKMEDIAQLQESEFRFPGFYIQQHTLRDYTYSCAAHVLGSIGEVSHSDIERDPYYASGDYAGRDGVEYTYENSLRGEKGVEVLLRDSKGRIKGSYENGAFDKAPKAGENITLTIDIKLQEFAEQMLQGKLGSIVAIEPHTGEILTLASNPTWDPAIMIGRQRGNNYMSLLNDPTKPLMNRATQASYAPGSTFKTVQACVELELGGITPSTPFPCSGTGSKPIRCTHSHGSPVALVKAIEQSCNPYFWHAYRVTLEKNGYGNGNEKFRDQYSKWRTYIMSFGLGKTFEDADLYQQKSGRIPSVEMYDKWYGPKGWKALTIRSNSIGQGEVELTPLQLANMVATIANGGYYITPHLNKNDSMLSRRHQTLVSPKWFSYVQEGMFSVLDHGTGRRSQIPGIDACGKTGTAQNSHGKDHSVFVVYAPKDNPKIAVAVIIENGGFGATWAAPMGSLMVERYLTDSISRPDLYDRMCNSVINTNVIDRKHGRGKKFD